MRKVLLTLVLATAALLIGRPASAQQFEHIRDFRAEVVVLADGSVEVTEEIEVVALGHTIKRGIYRDLKLTSYDPMGLFSPDFAVLEATRDGAEETHRVSSSGAGVRVSMTEASRMMKRA